MWGRRLAYALIVMAASLGVAGAALGDFSLTWWTVDAGGATGTTGGPYELGGTIGQTDTSPFAMTGGTFELTGGFWTCAAVATPIAGDCDGDGDVDVADFEAFVGCMAGPLGGLAPQCICADIDADGDADMDDFAPFQRAFTGQIP